MYEFGDAFYLQSEGGLLNGGLLKSPMRLLLCACWNTAYCSRWIPPSLSEQDYALRSAFASKVCSLFSSDSSRIPVQRLLAQSNQDWFSLRLHIWLLEEDGLEGKRDGVVFVFVFVFCFFPHWKQKSWGHFQMATICQLTPGDSQA